MADSSRDDIASVARREMVTTIVDDLAPTGRHVSYLPPMETVLERFIADRRRVRACDTTAKLCRMEAAE